MIERFGNQNLNQRKGKNTTDTTGEKYGKIVKQFLMIKIKNQNDSENSNRLKIEKGNKEMRKTRKPLKIIQSCKNIQINTYEKRNIIDILLSKISKT